MPCFHCPLKLNELNFVDIDLSRTTKYESGRITFSEHITLKKNDNLINLKFEIKD